MKFLLISLLCFTLVASGLVPTYRANGGGSEANNVYNFPNPEYQNNQFLPGYTYYGNSPLNSNLFGFSSFVFDNVNTAAMKEGPAYRKSSEKRSKFALLNDEIKTAKRAIFGTDELNISKYLNVINLNELPSEAASHIHRAALIQHLIDSYYK